MSEPVWSLSVDLQAKTATFQSGLADAARAARGSFSEIKDGAAEAGEATGYSMMEARHGVQLLGEEFGVHIPRALTSFIASLGPIGSAMEIAFPFLAIAVGATLLLEHLAKLREEGTKLTASQMNFGTTVANVLNGLNDKLLEAGIKTDELNGNHLSALNKQLQLIDHASMRELVESFNTVAKSADVTFAELKTSWYQFGAGSTGAKHALDEFKEKYDSLIAQGKDKEASDLLAGTKKSADEVLAKLQQAKSAAESKEFSGSTGVKIVDDSIRAAQETRLNGIHKEIEAQETLVGALQAQVRVEHDINEVNKAQKSNATTETNNKLAEEGDQKAKKEAEDAKRDAEWIEKIQKDGYERALSDLEESEKLKIDATQKGSAARLAAIDAAIKAERVKGLEETSFYKSLLQDRVNTERQITDEANKMREQAGKESAQQTLRIGELQITAEREKDQSLMAQGLMSAHERMASEERMANQELANQRTAAQQELAALDTTGKEYENKKQQINDKIEQAEKQHQNRMQQIQDQAAAQEYSRLTQQEQRMANTYAQGFSKVIMGKESFGKMMQQVDSQIAGSMIQHAIMSMIALDMTKEREAASAARKAFVSGMSMPPPANVFIAPAWAAAAFASVMAFESGGIVPGVGKGDTVPAMLEPGEGVLSNKQMDTLREAANGDAPTGGQQVHIHHHATYHVHALDGPSVDRVLQEHGEKFTDHVTNTLRKMNR